MADQLAKVSSGVRGLDEITGGGLPAGRPTLVVGGPGSGKTLLGTGFLVQGALHDGEPGVLVSFDERASDLEANSRSLGYDLAALQKRGLLTIEHVQIERQQLVEAGEYDLEGLFVRLGHAVSAIGAKRVVLDSVDTLFASIPNEAILRAELRRLFAWLKERRLSTIITGERAADERQISRHGIEEYVSDCVILLDTRIHDELATRRLRVVKYRGTSHGSNEYPFIIESTGITLLPVTSLGLAHVVSDERVSSGIPGLDAMLGPKGNGAHGYFKGTSVLLSGGPGTGKTSIAAQFAAATCARGERCVYFAFEESEPQLVRNMRSVSMNLAPFVANGFLKVHAVRPTLLSLEMHLASMMHQVQAVKPDAVVVDPLSALLAGGTVVQSKMMVLRLIDYIKSFGATALYLLVQQEQDGIDLNVSSLMDTWIVLENEAGSMTSSGAYMSPSRAACAFAGCAPISHRRQRHRDQAEEGGDMTGVDAGTSRYELRLYVAGQTDKSIRAIANLDRICKTHLEGRYRIEVIDLSKMPQLAAGEQILALPTLVRRLPEPMRQIIGDLSNEERVLVGLDIRPE